MITTFFGKKLTSHRVFTEAGKSIPVTEVLVTPGMVVQVKTSGKDGLDSLQVGFDWNLKKANQPLSGHLKKTGQTEKLPRFLREIRVAGEDLKLEPKAEISVDQVFKVGDRVKVTALAKGKGFQGGVRRHGFRGGPRTHGQSDRERAPGSIGQTTTPGRVYKGKRMAGRMGGSQKTVTGLTVTGIDSATNQMQIKGLVPGARGAFVKISKQNTR
ncbi:TPA: 50S ribosomal protein L3 [Patescibacteria group bacterium]|uniref:Large ribosomal subunit protein uL3 n=1 Tax=Candidatus Gottesmanbacteria bacterium GW2011_GWA1_43_11 TaxID=1618436 RepID=A0A0G1CGR3_9BACT|nr:MAG: 50S ribosomal protein L3 [Candidatus Gottesmanbacteria bacterium GW2011_GWA1_43_11]HCS78452.1 50S ribosomal protein L3 [Patescibacteria group bacterium]